MIVLIDNYDSFSYNLFQMVGAIDPDIRVFRNDAVTAEEIERMQPSSVILSPGPGRPKDAGICEEVVLRLRGKIPVLGVCLGHQAICEAYGAEISYARKLMHGKQCSLSVDQESCLFRGMTGTILAGRYHSLAAVEETLPEALKVTARAADGEVMAVEDPANRVFGLQFHPESIMTPAGPQMLRSFLAVR